MTWEQLETLIRAEAAKQKRGFKTALAEKLGVTTVSVSKQLSGVSRIPPERVHVYLEALGLELCIRPKQL